MDERKSLIDIGIYTIADNKGKTYKIDKKHSVKYGGSSLIYHVEDPDGNYLMLKECYPYCLSDKIERCADGNLILSNNIFVRDEDDEKVFDSFKNLAFSEYEIIANISKSSKYFKSNNDFVYASYLPFKANGTIYMPIATSDSISLSEKMEMNWKAIPFSVSTILEMLSVVNNLLNATKNLHKNGWLHLDICPANIIISNADVVRLIDFNSSSLLNGMNADHRFSYKEGFSALELQYRARGIEYGEINESTDIYSIGAILFRMFCGRTITTFDKSCSVEWEKEIDDNLKEINKINELSQFKPEIIRIIKKATTNEQAKRYANVDELLPEIASLITLITSAPAVMKERSKGNKLLATVKKHRNIAIVTPLIFVLLLTMFYPNIRIMRAKQLYAEGMGKEAFLIIKAINKHRLPIQFCYPEEEVVSLANELYYNSVSGTESSTAFASNVVCAAEIPDENAIAAFLENGTLVIKEKNTSKDVGVLKQIKTEGVSAQFSINGRYCAIIDNRHSMTIYSLSNTALTPIYKKADVKNISFSENNDEIIMVLENGIYEVFSLNNLETLFDSSLMNIEIKDIQSFDNNTKTIDLHAGKELIAFIDTQKKPHIISYDGKNVGGTTETGAIEEVVLKEIAFSKDGTTIRGIKPSGGSINQHDFNETKTSNYIQKNGKLFSLFNGKVVTLKGKIVVVEFVDPLATTKATNVKIADIPYREDRGYTVDGIFDCVEVIGEYTLYYSNYTKQLLRIDNYTNQETIISISIAGDNVRKIIANDINNILILSSNQDGHYACSYEIKNNIATPTSPTVFAKNIYMDEDDEHYMIAMSDTKVEVYYYTNLLKKYDFGNEKSGDDLAWSTDDKTQFLFAKLSKDKKSVITYASLKNVQIEKNSNLKDVITGIISIYNYSSSTNQFTGKNIEIPLSIAVNMIIKNTSDDLENLAVLSKNLETNKLHLYSRKTDDFPGKDLVELSALNEALVDCKYVGDDIFSLDKKEIQSREDTFILRRNEKEMSKNVCSQNVLSYRDLVYYIERNTDGDTLMCVETKGTPCSLLKSINEKLFCTSENVLTYMISKESDKIIRIVGVVPYKNTWRLYSATYNIYNINELINLLDNIYK